MAKFRFWCECDHYYISDPGSWLGCPECGSLSNSGNYAFCVKCGKVECINKYGEQSRFEIDLKKLLNHKCEELEDA